MECYSKCQAPLLIDFIYFIIVYLREDLNSFPISIKPRAMPANSSSMDNSIWSTMEKFCRHFMRFCINVSPHPLHSFYKALFIYVKSHWSSYQLTKAGRAILILKNKESDTQKKWNFLLKITQWINNGIKVGLRNPNYWKIFLFS